MLSDQIFFYCNGLLSVGKVNDRIWYMSKRESFGRMGTSHKKKTLGVCFSKRPNFGLKLVQLTTYGKY